MDKTSTGDPGDNVADRYLDMLSGQRTLSDNTVENYRRDLEQLAELAGKTALISLSSADIRPVSYTHLIHFSVRERNSSRPVAPGVASPNGNSFSSSSPGVWSEQMASMVPSSSPCVMASRSACERRGGVRRAFVSK